LSLLFRRHAPERGALVAREPVGLVVAVRLEEFLPIKGKEKMNYIKFSIILTFVNVAS
jgi:hypothetical protein